MRAVDTNILIYVHDPRDSVKQTVAANLVQSLTDGALLWQVACEYIAAARKVAAYGFDLDQAFQSLNSLQRVWPTLLPSWEVMTRAEQLIKNYHLSSWDALIVAACLEREVTHFYTEDMGGTPTIEGLFIINPFNEDVQSSLTQLDGGEGAEGKELFDYLAEAEEGAGHMTAIFREFTEENGKLNASLDKYNPILERIVQTGGARRFSELAKINLLLASDMNRYSRWVESVLPGFSEAAIKMKEGYTFYFNNIRLETEEQRLGLEAERAVLDSLLSTMGNVIQAARRASQNVESLAGHATKLTQASRRMVRALDGYISAATDIESFCLSALDIVDSKLEGGA